MVPHGARVVPVVPRSARVVPVVPRGAGGRLKCGFGFGAVFFCLLLVFLTFLVIFRWVLMIFLLESDGFFICWGF
ncbi:hypothetical protein Hdeb2414_s0008g00274751 [Helianthus debilis subsp. tardiflorus]